MTTEQDRADRTRIPRPLQGLRLEHTGWPGHTTSFNQIEGFAKDATKTYDAGSNVVVQDGKRDGRIRVMAAFANEVRAQETHYYRIETPYKYDPQAVYPDGPDKGKPMYRSMLSFPYSVVFMGVRELNKKWTEIDKDQKDFNPYGPTWDEWVYRFDFFFLTELGEEYVNAFKADIVQDVLGIRYKYALPTIVSLAGRMQQSEKYGPVAEYDSLRETLASSFSVVSLGRAA